MPVLEEGSLVVKKPTLVKQIPAAPLKIGNKTYKFKSLLMHCGDIIAESAHYIAWVKGQRGWLKISDETISCESKWPSNGYEYAGKKSAYMLFYAC